MAKERPIESAPGRFGVFCLEGDWDHTNLANRQTVQPMLDLLERQRVIKYIRRDVGTIAELEHYLKRWMTTRYDDYWFLYLGFHGSRGRLDIGSHSYGLDPLGQFLGSLGGTRRSVVHFGSCSMIRVPPSRLEAFSRRADIHSVSGFSKDVDWTESAILEMALLTAIGDRQHRVRDAYKRVDRDHAAMVKRLDFHHV